MYSKSILLSTYVCAMEIFKIILKLLMKIYFILYNLERHPNLVCRNLLVKKNVSQIKMIFCVNLDRLYPVILCSVLKGNPFFTTLLRIGYQYWPSSSQSIEFQYPSLFWLLKIQWGLCSAKHPYGGPVS